MNTPSSKPKFRSVSILGYGTLTLVSLLFLTIWLDSILRRELWFSWMEILFHVPATALVAGIGGYQLYKAVKSPPDKQPLSLGRRIILFCLFMLFAVVPVLGIWTIIDEIAVCRQIKAEGKEVVAKVEDVVLEYGLPGPKSTTVRTPGEANELNVKLQFTAESVIVKDRITLTHLVNRDAIARVWSEAQTGTLKVKYLPEKPDKFVVAAAPCRDSIFVVFLQK